MHQTCTQHECNMQHTFICQLPAQGLGREAHRRQTTKRIPTYKHAHIRGIVSPYPLSNKAALARLARSRFTPPQPSEVPSRTKMLILQNGTYEYTAVYSAIQHPEPQIFPENTSTNRDRTFLYIRSHAQFQIRGVQAKSSVWLSH